MDGTFTIRGKAAGHTIEKIYPLSFTKFEKVLVIDSYKVRRSRLYYIRDKVGKDAKFASIATAEEKGIDLLELAIAEAKAIHAVAVPVVAETTTDEAPATDTTDEAPATDTTDEAPATDTTKNSESSE